jgi:photosystem II stability/assembly factor-like uncharacterized protein
MRRLSIILPNDGISSNNMTQTIYAGMAGDTDEGRFVSFGLYRSREGSAWERIDGSFEQALEVRAILTDFRRPASVMIGTQIGILRSDDHGANWRRLTAPTPKLAVWSLARHPNLPDVIVAGYEPAAIYRTIDDGESWENLPLSASYPDIASNPAIPKRITAIAFDETNPQEMYASLEIGGLLRTVDGGAHWQAAIDGIYVVEDAVDLHGVVVNPSRTGRVTVTTRVGTFQSDDRGDHWRKLDVPALREKGSYCRAITYAPGRSETLFLGAGNDFDGDKGALFISEDDGTHWRSVDLPGPLKSTIFALAINNRLPDQVHCATKNGGVFSSADGGRSWRYRPLPRGAGHAFSLALG